MSQPFIGEIKIVPYNFAPLNWAFCWGQLLPIAGNEALFNLIGTIYGGDGEDNFGMPDLRGRRAYHQGQGPGLTTATIGEVTGTETVTLINSQMPQHTHTVTAARGATTGPSTTPTGATWSNEVLGSPQNLPYTDDVASSTMSPAALDPAGGSQPHENRPPFLALNFVIALAGIFPIES
jgi:microcystin-dependent protein